MATVPASVDERNLSIPVNWLEAASYFAELRNHRALSNDEWKVVTDWLASTKFNDRSYLAGEVAAGLIRDLAPSHVKASIKFTGAPDRWQQHFQTIISSDVNRVQELSAGSSQRPTAPT